MFERIAFAIGMAICAFGIGSVRAETPSFCSQYASKALHDARQARANPRCNANLDPGVFSTDYNVHYNWCLRVDANRAYAGTEQREAHLRRCTAASGPSRPSIGSVVPPGGGGAGRGPVRVTSATYGASCGVPAGNVSQNVAAICNGRAACDYSVNVRVLSDPAPNCRKNFVVTYYCGREGPFQASAPAEAGYGSRVAMRCN